MNVSEKLASNIVTAIADQSGYELVYAYHEDAAKDDYWRKLYPTTDDWQVLRDLAVLNQLEKHNDLEKIPRSIHHWASLPSKDAASSFAAWLGENGYEMIDTKLEEGNRMGVFFSHHGTAELADVTGHTILLNRRLLVVDSDYQGWECKVVTETIPV